jgi:uncharacterized protein (DUF1015 family)
MCGKFLRVIRAAFAGLDRDELLQSPQHHSPMAQILPFQAWRFNPAKVRLEDVLTQPYDKITPQMQSEYYAKSPYNLVRVELGKKEPTDTLQSSVYTRAAEFLQSCRKDGALAQDPEAAIYPYSQTFAIPGRAGSMLTRRGFIAVGRLHDYGDGIVHRHEQTLSKPKADRLDLLRATKVHTGQIFMLYSDHERRTESVLWGAAGRQEPVAQMQDEYGVMHRLWKITDSSAILAVRSQMEDKKLIIADGHHRYETALAYRNERRSGDGMQPADFGRTGHMAVNIRHPYEHLMMTFINVEDEGLLILPTHRVVFGLQGFSSEQFLRNAAKYFRIQQLAPGMTAAAATGRLHAAGEEGTAFIARTKDGVALLEAVPAAIDAALAGQSPLQSRLDVVRLHKLLLESVLGISEQAIREQTNVEYLRSAEEAFARVDAGADVAFLMNPVNIHQMRDVALNGEVMPQKSTDFYPKLMSGLTIYDVQ